jgi:hypothetical protein
MYAATDAADEESINYENVTDWVNLTGKDIRFVTLSGETNLVVPASETVAEIKEVNLLAGDVPVEGVSVSVYSKLLEINGLPETPDRQTVYFVTREVALAARVNDRPTYDLIIPTTPVRGSDDAIIGFRNLAYLA